MKVRKFIVAVSIFLFILLLLILRPTIMHNRNADPGIPDDRIETMSWGVVLFFDEHKRLPLQENWKDELLPYIYLADMFPNYDQAKIIYRDQWDNYFHYEVDGENYSFYSNGRNGIDEKGIGDDVKLSFNIVDEMKVLEEIREEIREKEK